MIADLRYSGEYMDQSAPTRVESSRGARRLVLILILIIFAAAGCLLFWFDSSARREFREARDVVEQLALPSGARHIQTSAEGNGLYYCVDTRCPSFGRVYVVPIEIGQEQETISRIFATSNVVINETSGNYCETEWYVHCWADSTRDGLLITVNINSVGADRPVDEPPPGTDWRRLSIGASHL